MPTPLISANATSSIGQKPGATRTEQASTEAEKNFGDVLNEVKADDEAEFGLDEPILEGFDIESVSEPTDGEAETQDVMARESQEELPISQHHLAGILERNDPAAKPVVSEDQEDPATPAAEKIVTSAMRQDATRAPAREVPERTPSGPNDTAVTLAVPFPHNRYFSNSGQASGSVQIFDPEQPPDIPQQSAEADLQVTVSKPEANANMATNQPRHSGIPPVTGTMVQAISGRVEQKSENIVEGALDSADTGFSVSRETAFSNFVREVTQTPQQASVRADMAKAIAGQLATVISGSGAQRIEIALSPEELGRVSIMLNGREDGMHLVIAAERPETLDLMRRHIAVLSGEFQKLGYSNLSFDMDLSGNAQDGEKDSPIEPSLEMDDTDGLGETVVDTPQIGALRGLDMRI